MSRTRTAAATFREQATIRANIPPPPGFSSPVHLSVSQSHFMDPQKENVTATKEHTGYQYHISTEVGGNPASLLLLPSEGTHQVADGPTVSVGQRLQYRMNEVRAIEKVSETCNIEPWISVDSAGGGMTVNLSRFHYEILK